MLTNVSNLPASSPRATNTPSPAFRRQRDSAQSPYSWGRTSNDGLMSSPATVESPTSDEPPPVPKHAPYSSVKGERSSEERSSEERSSDELAPPSRPILRQQNSFSRSGADGDADARMVRESFIATSRQSINGGSPLSRAQMTRSSLMLPQNKSAMSSDNSLNTPSTSSSSSSTPASKIGVGQGSSSPGSTPRASRSNVTPAVLSDDDEPLFRDEPLFDLSPKRVLAYIDGNAGRPSHPQKQANRPEPQKVMTAAEFKNLRQKENVMSTGGNAADSDSGDEYEDDEDDPALLAQKRKIQQEKDAQFALWRQQNKKAIGDHSAPLPPGYANPDRSTPNFSLQAPSFAGVNQNGLEEDQDDDVPLGILAQHGFPSKKNPPVSTNNDARMYMGQSSGGASPSQGRPVSSFRLPPFARKLPEDPYMGTSDLVNPVNRQPLGMGRTGAPSVYGDSGRGGSPSSSVPPGGLVGVIQEEERLKSMRRGSPNYNGTYSKPIPQQGMGGPQGQMTPQQASIQQMTYGMGVPLGGQSQYGMMQGMPSPQQYPMNPMMDPAFAHQMSAYMAFHQQMMGQMGGYMGQHGQMGMPGQVGPDPMGYMGYPPQMGMPMTGLPPPQSRPLSMASQQGPRPPLHQSRTMSMTPGPRPQPPRTMSMMNYQASMNGFGMPNQVYAPSLAPSERSNIGNPGRYRPVSTIRNGTDGGSTVTPSSPGGTSPAFLSATIHTGKKANSKPTTDDQDASEWANLALKRLNRRGE
jgi:hypothetical protein